MERIIGSKRALVLLCLLAVVIVAAGCGSSTETMPKATGVVLSASTPTAGMNTCAGCHEREAADWLGSGHANLSSPGDLQYPGNPTIAQITGCESCHDPNGDSSKLAAANLGKVPRPVVGCESCHGPGSLHANAGGVGPISLIANTNPGTWQTGTVPVSGQFIMCTSCHELLDSGGTGTAAAVHYGGAESPQGSQYAITNSHFAVAVSSRGPVIGYSMDFANQRVCIECHDPHKNADIERQWAMSAKGERTSSGPWARNWSTNPACQRCHTTTGFAAYADALADGKTKRAHDILYGTLVSSPVPSAATWKPEMLLCKGCHTDNKGSLRNPGAYTADYSYSFYVTPPTLATIYSVASHAYPDLRGSNQCMPCHTGRQNGDSIKNMNSAGSVAAIDFSNNSTLINVNAHHYQAGAVMYQAAGYNYTGRDYSNPSQFRHDQIGSDRAPGTGTNGPCVGCHMLGQNGQSNHLFLPISSTTTTSVISGMTKTTITITTIPSGACSTCHGPDPIAFLNLVSQEKNFFADAQSALQYVLGQAGFYKRGSSYYKARDLSVITAGTVTAVNGTDTITGIKTNWDLVALETGDKFRIDNDGAWYTIANVDSATGITLSSLYTGTTYTSTAGVSYTIQKTETAAVTKGSPTVIGTGTNWTSLVAAGDKFRVDSDGTWYTILSVDADTAITLSTNYLGSTTPAAGFSLRNTTTASVLGTTVTITGANPLTLDVGMPPTSTSGDYFRIDGDGTWYRITNRDVTTLTLATPYTGTIAAGAYTIIRNAAVRSWLTSGDTDINGNTTGKNNIGAAFNLNMLTGTLDPAAYVHNRHYVKKLIYDSIDWLDDGQMNFSPGTTLNSICSSSAPLWCTGAKSYLLRSGLSATALRMNGPKTLRKRRFR